jgi:preprotein translocase subunit SecE
VTETRSSSEAHADSASADDRSRPRKKSSDSLGKRIAALPGRVSLFYRQVVSELRKVVWPTRRELSTYTTVVIIFCVVVISVVATMDYGIGKLITLVFG